MGIQPGLQAEAASPSSPDSRFAAERRWVALCSAIAFGVTIPASYLWGVRAERIKERRQKAEAHSAEQRYCGEAIRLIDALAEIISRDNEAEAELAAERRKTIERAEYHASMRSKWEQALTESWWKPTPSDPSGP